MWPDANGAVLEDGFSGDVTERFEEAEPMQFVSASG
jgi:hypothetical protein